MDQELVVVRHYHEIELPLPAGCGNSLRSLLPLSYLPLVRGRRLRKEAIFHAGCWFFNRGFLALKPFCRTLLEGIFLDLRVELLARDAQQVGGMHFVAASALQRPPDQVALGFGKRGHRRPDIISRR